MVIAFITNGSSDFWSFVRRGCEKADEELPDIEVEFRIPGGSSAAEQRRIFEDLLARGVDGIAISPIDPKNSSRWLNAGARKCALITCESDAPTSARLMYIGTNNRAAGLMAGKAMRQAVPDGGKVMVFCDSLDNVRSVDRLGGLKQSFLNSNIEIIDVRTDDSDRLRAISNAEDAIVKHKDLVGMVGLSSYSGPSIYAAVKAARKKGKLAIVCFDEEPGTLKGIKEDGIYATIVQQPYKFGYEAIHRLSKYLKQEKYAIPISKKTTFPAKVIGQAEVWDFEVIRR